MTDESVDRTRSLMTTAVVDTRVEMARFLRESGIREEELPDHLSLFMTPHTMSSLVSKFRFYELIRDIPGDICEFGVRYGTGLMAWNSILQINEPTSGRGVFGFDTFTGLAGVDHDVDGTDSRISEGAYDVPDDYANKLIKYFRTLGIGRVGIVRGDICEHSVDVILDKLPSLQCALAYFDLDIYAPTIAALEAIEERLMLGSVIVFDEFAMRQFPGETVAVREFFGHARMRRFHDSPRGLAYLIYEGR